MSVLLALLICVDVHFGLEAITNAPISVGGRASVGLPHGLEVSTEVGVLPPFYAGAINSLLVGVGVYPAEVGVLVRTGLQTSFVWRSHLGWSFWRGLYVAAGYGLVSFGGGLAAGDAVASISGQEVPSQFVPNEVVRLAAQLHMVDAEIGYRFLAWDQLVVRIALGGAFTVGSRTRISTDRLLLQKSDYFQAFARVGGAMLDNVFRSYVFSPVLTLSVGYRFF